MLGGVHLVEGYYELFVPESVVEYNVHNVLFGLTILPDTDLELTSI